MPAISTTGGASTNEDHLLVLRREELPVCLGPIQFNVSLAAFQSGTDSLTVRAVAFQHISTLFGRTPLAVAKVSGTGFASVTFA